MSGAHISPQAELVAALHTLEARLNATPAKG